MQNLNFTTEQIAKEFSNILKQWLGEESMKEIVALTIRETDPSICHTGDYCDSNMAMHGAMINLGVLTEDDEDFLNETITNLFNDSWDLAKKNLFYMQSEETAKEIVVYLSAKYNKLTFATVGKNESCVEDEEAPEVLVSIEYMDMSIIDPFSSECSRFIVDPVVQYKIELKDAQLISNYNKVSN